MLRFQLTAATLCICIAFTSRFAKAAEEEPLPPPQTPGIAEALAEYQAACDQARAAFVKKLRETEQKAKSDGNNDEVARLEQWLKRTAAAEAFPELDPLADARAKLAGSSWTFDRPARKDTNRMTFHKGGVWQTTVPQKGHWVLATDRMVICSYHAKQRDELFVFDFDEEFKTYKVRAFGDVATQFVSGRRAK